MLIKEIEVKGHLRKTSQLEGLVYSDQHKSQEKGVSAALFCNDSCLTSLMVR